MKGLSILGSTGSVGTNVLRIVDSFPERFRVVGLSGGENVRLLAEQVTRYRPVVVSVATEAAREALCRLVDGAGLGVGGGSPGRRASRAWFSSSLTPIIRNTRSSVAQV